MSETVRRRLPPLNSLRAFEAAGRRSSFALAADEIGVTLSAVSHQIRQLEDALGSLFHRTGRGVELSDEGRLLLPELTAGFERIARTISEFEARRPVGILTVSMPSTFAMRWFIPRLQRFQAACPEIEVRISTAAGLDDLDRDGVDCAIRFGDGAWPGLRVDRLFGEQLSPVCHPRLTSGQLPLRVPADLRRYRLLHARMRPDDWRIWLDAVGVHDCDDQSTGLTFETRNFAIQAALDGIGVAIVDPSLVSEELAAGRLVRPFATSLPGEGAYYFVCLDAMASTPRIARFRAWLLAETQPPMSTPAQAPAPASAPTPSS